jgi:hypothetical protein
MKGLELSEKYFNIHGLPMLQEQFPSVLHLVACGLFGSGSECFGFDDSISRDHDFEPGFMILLPDESVIDRRTAFQMERAYAKLPKEFEGFQRCKMQPVGGSRHGVIRIADFMREKTGTADGLLSRHDWLSIPEQALAETVNGKIFYDGSGELTEIRSRLSYFPESIWKKKIAGNLLLMAQSGQYNYMRCLAHKEPAAAQLAVFEFVKHAISAVFLLNRQYQPYYKWCFHALRDLPMLSIEAELFELLITTDNEEKNSEEKYRIIEGIASDIIDLLIQFKLTEATCGDLEKHAYSVNDGIEDTEIRNMHILAALD